MKNYIFGALCFFLFVPVFAQNTQNQIVRGTVRDLDSKHPMIGVTVMVVGSEEGLGGVTDIEGQFEIREVPVGRVDLKFSFVGYKTVFLNQQLLEIGKELVLDVSMEEDIQQMDAITVVAEASQGINNEAAVVSSRSFDVEETRRYAGARNDVARMASNFAGVANADDSRNDIVVRGNSPVSLLWRLEGVDIPSPNHYNTLGTTGGPVSILNNNNLSNSDFITSAFPSAYGNTISGVFDLQMKKGNGFSREYMGQVGFNGFEFGVEGPFFKSSQASYMANYRFSTLGAFKALGIDFGVDTTVPEYQDLTFSLDLPTSNLGSFRLFGIGGTSEIHFAPEEKTDDDGNLYTTSDLKNDAKIGVLGLKHIYYFNPNIYLSSTLASSYQHSAVIIDSVENNAPGLDDPDVVQNQSQAKYSLNSTLVMKLNARNRLELGANLNFIDANYRDSIQLEDNEWFRYTDFGEGTLLSQAHVQHQVKLSEKFQAVGGIHLQYLDLVGQAAIEPRLGLTYSPNPLTSVSAGYGLHSQMQPLIVNFFRTEESPDGSNSEVGFTRSHHFSVGLTQGLFQDISIKVESYYQHLFDVPIEQFSSSYSILNSGTSFGFEIVPDLVNQGFGKNYGVELTIEKSLTKSHYFLLTTSLFESKYQGSDGVWRNTAFNNQYIVNLLGGSEFEIGPSGALTTDIKLTFSGGRHYTPIDLDQSIAEGEPVYFEDEAFSLQYDPYFRTDFKIGYRLNMKKVTQEWLIDFQNLFNTQNIFEEYFDPNTNSIEQRYQLGLFVIPQYRILF